MIEIEMHLPVEWTKTSDKKQDVDFMLQQSFSCFNKKQ